MLTKKQTTKKCPAPGQEKERKKDAADPEEFPKSPARRQGTGRGGGTMDRARRAARPRPAPPPPPIPPRAASVARGDRSWAEPPPRDRFFRAKGSGTLAPASALGSGVRSRAAGAKWAGLLALLQVFLWPSLTSVRLLSVDSGHPSEHLPPSSYRLRRAQKP